MKNHLILMVYSNNKSVRNLLPGYITQDGLFASKLSLSLREVWFNNQKFFTGLLISNIKYNHLRSQKNNTFYPFNNQLDYILAHFFIDFKTIKSNVNRFLSNSLIVLFTKKLFYQNADKWRKKFSKIP